jgi:ATP-grasp domain
MRKPLWYIKWTQFEYWPTWLLYLPSLFYFVFLAFKSKSFSYFTIVNPKIYLGGFHGESKADIFRMLPTYAIPKWFTLNVNTTLKAVQDNLLRNEIKYPFILKPDDGCRGQGVHKVETEAELVTLRQNIKADYIIQSYVDYEIELAVLYYKFPNQNKSGITSIAIKEFMSVKGDGEKSILQLMESEDRFRFQIEKESAKLGEKINVVPKLNEVVLLEPIGNHCRGTKFLNGNNLISPQLVTVFDNIMQSVDGINFCRFDMRVKDLDSLYKGENFSILELNGVGSDPAHIYDPSMKWSAAMRAINENMKIVFDISKLLHQQGVQYPPFSLVWKEGKNHLF